MTILQDLKNETSRILKAFEHDAAAGLEKAEHALHELFDKHPATNTPANHAAPEGDKTADAGATAGTGAAEEEKAPDGAVGG